MTNQVGFLAPLVLGGGDGDGGDFCSVLDCVQG